MNENLKRSALFRSFLILSILFILFYATIWKEKPEVIPAFYFWEGRTDLNDEEDSILEDQHVKKLYVKFFEVEMNQTLGPIPITKSQLYLAKPGYDSIQVIPTVYIQNEVFKEISEDNIDALADNIWHLIKKKYKENVHTSNGLEEIQMDCDWTLSTKNNYITFLNKLKAKINCQLSATLRLYPYKFPDKMGVLPVDRAMLMCYNLLPAVGSNNANSILEISELEKYLIGAKPYPVPLDIGLPLFSNTLVYKNNQFAGIMHSGMEPIKPVLKPFKKYWYLVIRDTVIDQVYLQKGNKIKFENVSNKKIEKAIDVITENVSLSRKYSIAFFYLNNKQLAQYESKEIRGFYRSFNH